MRQLNGPVPSIMHGMGWVGDEGHYTESSATRPMTTRTRAGAAIPNPGTACRPPKLPAGRGDDRTRARQPGGIRGCCTASARSYSGYVSADLLVASRLRGLTLLGPLRPDAAQAGAGG